MAEIFVSYRRDDTGILCERVTSRLTARFGERRVFRDANAIYIGSAWEQTLRAALQDCYVVIALMGTGWLSACDAQGRPRLFDPHDFVRMELATALTQQKRIIPVLVNGARMPHAHELPPDLAPLIAIPPLILRPDPYFDSDMLRLIQAADPGTRGRIPHLGATLCGIVGMLCVLVATFIALAEASMGVQFSDSVLLIFLASLLILAGGVLGVIARSLATRAWVWLTLASLVMALALTSTAGIIALPLYYRQNPEMVSVVALAFVVAQILAVILTLVFGFFGPRSLSPFRATV